jgi:hypothetical protein
MSSSSAPPPTSNAAVEPTELRPADPSRPVLGTMNNSSSASRRIEL